VPRKDMDRMYYTGPASAGRVRKSRGITRWRRHRRLRTPFLNDADIVPEMTVMGPSSLCYCNILLVDVDNNANGIPKPADRRNTSQI